ncbi:MAG: hypothetical protein AABW92_03610 [Nanoarchaeota archaeon]
MTPKEIAVTFAIAVLFTTFVIVTVDAFYPKPNMDDLCNNPRTKPYLSPIKPDEECNITWRAEENKCYEQGGNPEYGSDNSGCRTFDSCNFCYSQYNEINKNYSNNLFLILAPLGALAILFGVYYKPEFLGSGFMYSGIIIMFYGTIQNFGELNRYVKSLVILLELSLVLFIAFKKIINKK